jgi:hypothetical protein
MKENKQDNGRRSRGHLVDGIFSSRPAPAGHIAREPRAESTALKSAPPCRRALIHAPAEMLHRRE